MAEPGSLTTTNPASKEFPPDNRLTKFAVKSAIVFAVRIDSPEIKVVLAFNVTLFGTTMYLLTSVLSKKEYITVEGLIPSEAKRICFDFMYG